MSEGAEFVWNVRRYWHWFLVILSGLFVIVLVISIGFVGRLSEVGLEPDSAAVGGETINREKLDQVLKIFEDKAAATQTLLKVPPAVVDPAP